MCARVYSTLLSVCDCACVCIRVCLCVCLGECMIVQMWERDDLMN